MRNLVITAAIAALIGSAVTLAWPRGDGRGPAPAGQLPVAAPQEFDPAAPLAERVAALETALSVERQSRQILEDELLALNDLLDALGGPAGDGADDEPAARSAGSAANSEGSEARGRSRRSRDDPELRRERLVDAGFSPVEADRIVQRESELRMAAIRARYEARRTGEFYDFRARDQLREELGDDAYGRYLEATGRPVTVTVSAVLESSPALAAGLQPGDEIVRYDGRRVFSMDEITDLTVAGDPGENVVIDITRGGVPMQLSIPRGPLGVSGGRRFRR